MSDITTTSAAETMDNTAADPFAPGNWFWVTDTDHKGETNIWLGCVIRHGSNYVYVEGVAANEWCSAPSERIHVRDLYTKLKPEPNAESVIKNMVSQHQDKVAVLLGKIKKVTERLGIVPKTAIMDQTAPSDNALAVVSQQVDTTAYKKELIKAKDEDLPALFKEVEREHKLLAAWMKAPILPMQAAIHPMKSGIKGIEDRIYTIELYAGLTEFSEKVKDGDPARTDEPLHVMQRKHFMDEECLLDYDLGGMEFRDIRQFAEWLSRPQNFDRLLPFQRCCVAFQIRRNVKERYASSLWESFINIQLEQTDKFTYLFVRNGEQLWMVGCDFEFGDKIFPDQNEFDPANGGYMITMFAGSIREIITRNEYEVEMAKYQEKLAAWETEQATLDKKDRHWSKPSKPSYYDEAEPLDPSSVYYDDGMEMVDGQVKEYNRIAVILQGLFDRSLCLHPHPPVSVWDQRSFETSIKLVYDATTLTYGDPPDYEAYVATLRESLGEGSVTIGQQQVWMEREAQRENDRTSRSWREKQTYHETFTPYGDPGPGKLARVVGWKPRARKALFKWQREAKAWQNYGQFYDVSIEVDAARLFNVSAYQPGDYLQFFKDPRTRQQYLKWAPMLLLAEEFHAGNKKVNN